MLLVLSGGTGTPKLLQGLARSLPPEELSVLVNTAEDVEVSGLHVSPDLDTVTYTLAGIVDDRRWYGIRGDTFFCYEMLKSLGHEELLRLGDRDRAIKSYRTMRLQKGASLSEVTTEISRRLGIRSKIMPMSDDRVVTKIHTETRKLSFHEFWVVRKAADRVVDVNFEGVEKARPAPGVVRAIKSADGIIIGPSNPVTSIGPILAIKGIHEVLSQNREKVLAISPIVGSKAVSGPTGALMRGIGYNVTPASVAQLYQDVVSKFMLHQNDDHLAPSIEAMWLKVTVFDLLMPDHASRVRLARKALETLGWAGK
jgi:LPPG:FO 2-phospho-L-lactate transferase